MARNHDELQEVIDNNDQFLMACGLELSNFTMERKPELMNALWLHFVFFEVHAELQQFKKGFRETLQMEVLLSQNPIEVRALLVPSEYKIRAKDLFDLFTIDYSENQGQRCLEEAVVAYWRRYIIGLETEGTYYY